MKALLAGFSSGLLLLGPLPLCAQSDAVLEVGRFSAGTPGQAVSDGWTPLTFSNVKQHTRYELVNDGSLAVVKARSESSASGLIRKTRIDPREYPIMRWRWKVENILAKSDILRKDGDDYPVRVYVTFEYDPARTSLFRLAKYQAARLIYGDIPIAALVYVWDSRAPAGLFVDNAYTDFAKMVVVRSGPDAVGTWVEEERNVYDDYMKAFGEAPPMIKGVAIMTDTDDTKESATAYYGDIVFKKEAPR